jgi:aminoglycoside/choline kinase family phosphotransferase
VTGAAPGLEGFLDRTQVDATSLTPLAGDASTRRYSRGRTRQGSSVVLMENGEPVIFARWAAFYEELGLRVPRVLDLEPAGGLMLLEDLGDEMLQHRLESQGPEACRDFYDLAVDWTRVLVEKGTGLYTPETPNGDDPLVPKRLAWEMDFLLRHALNAGDEQLPEDPAAGALGPARSLLHGLCEDLHAASAAGLSLCHRDYHARNLVVTPTGELAVIDFQDTRRGPRAYDLASLLWDPYVSLPRDFVERLQERARPEAASAEAWDRELRLAAGQRLLKAAGSYAMLGRSKGRKEYLRWWAPALSRAFERLTGAWAPVTELERQLRLAGLDW